MEIKEVFKKEKDPSNIIDRIFEADYGNTMEIEITKLLLKNKFPILKRNYKSKK